MKQKTKERVLFCQFLKENNCVKQFVKAFNTDSEFKNLNDLFKTQQPRHFIFVAFTWGLNRNEVVNWKDLDYRWIDYLNQHNN
jgi:hypothetical protein